MNAEIHKLLEKKAISVVTAPYTQGFLSRIFLVPKKDGSQRPVINLRQLNQFVIWEHFKMESIHLVENLIQERLDDKNGSKRCLFLHSYPPRKLPMVTLPVARTSVRISVSPIRPVLSTTSVHQSDTAHSGMVETAGGENSCIHRRLSSVSTLQGGSSPPSPVNGDNLPSIGILSQHREIPPNSMSGDRISGSYDSVTSSNIPPATAQAAGNQIQSRTAPTQRYLPSDHHSPGDCPIYWNSQCCGSGNTTSPSILQIPPSNQTSFSKSGGGAEQSNSPIQH